MVRLDVIELARARAFRDFCLVRRALLVASAVVVLPPLDPHFHILA
jgi:hypothetical protein